MRNNPRILLVAIALAAGCASEPTPQFTPRYAKLEEIIIDSPDHDGVPITETEYQFGPSKVRFDDLKWRIYVNDQDYGPVKAGDVVKLGPTITVNGEARDPTP